MAVTMRLLTGPYAGQIRDVSGQEPMEILGSTVRHGWRWELDWNQMTPEEKAPWGRADLACRILLALQEGRSITLAWPEGQQVFRVQEDYTSEDLKKLAIQIEDVIVESGYNVFVVQDDDSGVVIGARP